ncbi:MAG: MBOAT family protein [Calditrichaeota bacterium]|nr:MBOAT family protein [Calditrichota bacterium]
MLFNSLQFAIFFIVVVSIYFSIPHRYRWILLLIASYYFYMCWNAKYIVLIVFSTLVDYFAGLQMSRTTVKRKRTIYLVMSLVTNLGLLFTFKYFNFFSRSVGEFFQAFSIPIQPRLLHVLLPVGISFYTFQTLSYTIDVYRGKIPHEKHLGIFALYVSFFPQLVAGPIERASNLLPQFYKKMTFDDERIAAGLRLMLWGFFKKIVVADRLALYVDAVYKNVDFHSGLTLLVATYLFAFQIYCDFSGYSDIAIGAARILGFDLMKNFDRPYFSLTIPEFWRRWHISLSTWFKDYLYIPLGGNRVPVARMYVNLAIVFVISGMWHGANWTFIFWGALHGMYIVSSRLSLGFRDRLVERYHINKKLVTFSRMFITFQLVCFAWIYFRADSLAHANLVVGKIFSLHWGRLYIPAMDQFVYSLIAVALLLTGDILLEKFNLNTTLLKQPVHVRWAAYASLAIVILLIGVFNGSQFIYFQF